MRYVDPRGSKLRALEQNILKYRAMQMVLIMFYAEELKRDIVSLVQNTDRLERRLHNKNEPPKPASVKGNGKSVEQALQVLMRDGALSAAEKNEIVNLIDYRNVVAHQIHNLLVDLSNDRMARDSLRFAPEVFKKYDYNAASRLRHYLDVIHNRPAFHRYVHTISFNSIFFESAEKTITAETKRLDKKIRVQMHRRKNEVRELNQELSLAGTDLGGDSHPSHPLCRYKNGRLTQRGVEVCYRLFDLGKTVLAASYLMELSYRSVFKRYKTWDALGGKKRNRVDIGKLQGRRRQL